MAKQYIGDQGEVSIFKIDKLPPDISVERVEPSKKGYIVSHSERGHHHLLEGGEVMERKEGVRPGMRILYALVKEPTRFYQDAPEAHGEYDLDPGIYEFRIAREYDPFSEQAWAVND